MSDALRAGTTTVDISLHTAPGQIHNAASEDLGALSLLATGRSNFAGSGEGRKSNVRKGLNVALNNLIVGTGEEFSINKVLKRVPMSQWAMALGIFNGGDLRPIPGGGLCQVATTLYRGVLHAGLPVTERSNHSLFVHYYEAYGVGIDATIYPASSPDLRFQNDTGHPLLIQSYTEEDEAYVNIYGTPDGRHVSLHGPYFAKNAPASLQVNGRALKENEIAWQQQVQYADGHEDATTILSHYKSIPSNVVEKYLHAAAGEETQPAN